jgi:hypothetical protein
LSRLNELDLNEMRFSQQDVAQHELDYMSNVLGAAKAYEVHELCDFELPDGGNDQWILDACRKFRVKAQHIAVQLRIKSTRRLHQYSVKFDGVAKEKLRHHLNQMRTLVDKAELPQGKKDRLVDLAVDVVAALAVHEADIADLGADLEQPIVSRGSERVLVRRSIARDRWGAT